MKRLLGIALVVLVAGNAAAQRRRQPQAGQTTNQWWAGADIGLMTGFTINDGTTNSAWQFGSFTPWRLTLERTVGGMATVGVAVIGERVPLSYISSGFTTGCANCNAHATMRQALLVLHNALGGEFFGIGRSFALGLGATGFSNFKSDDGSATIGPGGVDWDPTLVFGGRLSLPLGTRLEIQFTPEAQLLVHQRTGLAGGDD